MQTDRNITLIGVVAALAVILASAAEVYSFRELQKRPGKWSSASSSMSESFTR